MSPPNVPEPQAQVEAFSRRHRTGLVTLVFTDIVGSTALKQQLGDHAGAQLIEQHHALVRATLKGFPDGEELSTAGDSFFLVFATPSAGVKFALILQQRLRELTRQAPVPVQDRMGLHLGEVLIQEADQQRTKDLIGLNVDLGARVMGLAQGGQILLTRAVFDSARQALKGEDIAGVGQLSWLNHGLYQLKGIEEPVEICEVGEVGAGPLRSPATTEKARRVEGVEGESVLGWRPAVGQAVPNTQWVLEKKLGEGGFGEVWLGRHQTMKERRVFKFCFRADRVRSLKREMTLFRLIKERIGDHPNIVSLREVYFDQPPFYVEEDYTEGQDLASWCAAQGGADKVPLEVRLEIVAQIADALQAAHDAGVIHRDVKPANILVGSQRSEVTARDQSLLSPLASPLVKLTDFGIGQVVSQEYLSGVTKAGFTQTILADSSSSKTGTQLYLAPELLAGKHASIRSDIYSLGVVLYQLVVGDLGQPVTGDWAEAIQDPLLRDDLKHCLAGRTEERFAGAAQLARNLRQLPIRRAELAAQVRREAERSRRRYATRVGALLLGVALVATVALGYGLHQAKLQAHEARKNLYAADMLLAAQAVERDDYGAARELLQRHRPARGSVDLRGWEWRHLWLATRGDQLAEIGAHDHCIKALAFAPDGLTLYSAGDDATVRAWDWSARRQVSIYRYERAAYALVVTKDAKTLVTGHNDGTVRFQGLPNGNIIQVLTNRSPIRSLVLSPDGSLLGIGGSSNVTLINPSTRQVVADFTGPHTVFMPRGMAFTADGSLFTFHRGDGEIAVVDLKTLEMIRTLPRMPGGEVLSLEFSSDRRSLVAGTLERTIVVWEVGSWRPERVLTNHTGWIGALAFSPDGSTLVSASADQTLDVWNTSDWRLRAKLRGQLGEIWCARFVPGTALLVTGGLDFTLRLWDTRREHREATEIRGAPVPAPAAGDERVIVTSARGELSAVRDTAGTVSLRENLPPRQVGVLATSAATVAAGWFSSDFRSLLLLRGDRVLESWNVQNGSRESASPLAWQPSTWLLSPRGGLLLLSDRQNTELWQVRPLRKMATLPRHLWIFSHMAVSSDDGLLATAGYDGHVRLFRLPQGDLVADVRGARFASKWVGFSPDRSRLAAIYGEDRTLVFWDITRRPPQEVLRLSSPSLFGAQWKVNWTDESTLAINVLTSGNEAVDLRLVSPPLGEIDAAEKGDAAGQHR